MIFPRIAALAEAAWTRKENKSYDEFKLRLKPWIKYYKKSGFNGFDPFDPKAVPEPKGPVKKK